MASADSTPPVTLPIPISKLAHRYLLYSVPAIAYIRAHYNIPGVLIGSLPQAPQQNVFQGLPLELMPEEARWLVEKGVCVIIDDAAAHRRAFLHGPAEGGLSVEERRAWREALRRRGIVAAKEAGKRSEERKKLGLLKKKDTEGWNDVPEDMLRPSRRSHKGEGGTDSTELDSDSTIFPSTSSNQTATSSSEVEPELEPYAVTPTISHPPLAPNSNKTIPLPAVPSSYPLYTHLHDQKYFLTPGLRFGCNYMAYPGDPLRFHAHFLCKGLEWEQEFDLLELVGGGRLGTGVKKGFLVGGRVEMDGSDSDDDAREDGRGERESDVRCFCVEWGGM